MEFFPSRTTFLKIGSLSIQWYAVLILTGAFVAYYFSKKNLKEYKNIDVNGFFDDVFIYMLWGGIIGARLWFCVFNNFDYYISNPLQIIRIWDGGVAFHGAFAGGALTAYFYCRKKNVSFIKFLDCVLPTVLFAQAMGRWGNFINKECHGIEVGPEYFDGLLSFLKEGMHIDGTYYVPLFFYESMLCLLGFVLINFFLRKTQRKRGQLTGAYLIWYGIVRFFIEASRTDSLYVGTLKTAQVTSIAFVIAGLLLFFGIYDKLFNKKKPTIVFDLDGTLQDSTPAIIESFRATFEKYGNVEDFTHEREIEVLGPPIKEMFMKFMPDQDPDELCKYYRSVNAQKLRETLEPMKNAVEVTRALKAQGHSLGIYTTRNLESVKECLKLCGFDDGVFDAIIGLNDVEHTKPDPEGLFKIINNYKLNSSDVIMVGDSTADVGAGNAYGAYTIAYSVIDEKRAGIEASKPNRIITDLNEILDIIKEDHYFTYNLK